MNWENGKLIASEILSKNGNKCRLMLKDAVEVYCKKNKIEVNVTTNGIIEFDTDINETYQIKPIAHQ